MIPYGKQYIDEDDIKAVTDVLRSDWITSGPKIKEFEDALCGYIGCKHAVVVNSGTSALDISVQALGIPLGSEAITTPFTFAATTNALLYNGVKPVFADIKKTTWNIDPDSVRKKITKKTRAILYVDFAGHPCDIASLQEIAEEFNLFLIEDASHALGAMYHNTKVGNFADLTIFSFHPVKHITSGEGGAVALNNPSLYQRLILGRNHGIDRDAQFRYGPKASWAYDMKCLGRNYRMTDFQAALGISQLKKLDAFIEKRIHLVKKYQALLGSNKFITLPKSKPDVKHAWHIYCILLNSPVKRDEIFTYLRSEGIGVNVHYIPVYRHSYYQKNYPVRSEDYPVTENVFSRIITLPLFPQMTDTEVEIVVSKINNFFSDNKIM